MIRCFVLLATLLCLLMAGAASASGLVVCSWNLKHLGWNNHKNLPAVAQIMSRCDLVGMQEVMHPKQLQPLVRALDKQTGADWDVTSSHTVGDNGYKEGYAFVWRTAKVEHLNGDVLYMDPDHDFLRQPFSAVFRAADGTVPAFVAATVHIKYGDSVRDRTPEIRALADYWEWLGASFDNRPRILMGDFNLAIQGVKAWRPLSKLAIPHVIKDRTTLSKTNGQYAHAYDHFWVSKGLPVGPSGVIRAPQMLNVSHDTFYKYMSDHTAIYLTLGGARIDLSDVADPAITDQKGAAKVKTGCVDLNKAGVKRLATLPHVGPGRAKAIIDGRPWTAVDDLVKVRGLSAARVADIADGGRVCALDRG